MSMTALLIDPLRQTLQLNADYGRDLLAGVDESNKTARPAEEMNHPAWLLSHLNTYHPVALALLRGETPDDPLDAPFGMKSAPVAEADAYAPVVELLDTWLANHRAIADALENVDEATLMRPQPVARWTERFPHVGSILIYLLARHEGLHLGQLSTWRRAMSMPRV